MGLADHIQQEFHSSPAGGCSVGRVRDSLNDEDKEALDYAVRLIRANQGRAHNQYSGTTANALHRALKSEGYDVGKDAVQAHAYGRCSCES